MLVLDLLNVSDYRKLIGVGVRARIGMHMPMLWATLQGNIAPRQCHNTSSFVMLHRRILLYIFVICLASIPVCRFVAQHVAWCTTGLSLEHNNTDCRSAFWVIIKLTGDQYIGKVEASLVQVPFLKAQFVSS